jgi:hypothetical protein
MAGCLANREMTERRIPVAYSVSNDLRRQAG